MSAGVQTERALFSAPFAFIPGVKEAYDAVLPTTFTEIWAAGDVPSVPDITVWVVNPGQRFVIDGAILDRLPNLKLIVTPSTGTNHISRDACAARGIVVRGLLDDRAATETITASAEFTFLLLLMALRRPERGLAEIAAGRWRQSEDWMRGHELSDKHVGLVGYGRNGRRMARYAAAFGATVSYADPYVADGTLPRQDIAELFAGSDAVVVCCALTPETHGFIDAPLLRRLKQGACFVNTSRGEIVNENDLRDVLLARPDVTVAVDVLAGETTGTQMQSPLLSLVDTGQVIVTPHIAGVAVEAQSKAARIALSLVKGALTPETL